MGNDFPVFFLVYIMDHAQIDIIRFQPCQQILKGNAALFGISCAGILPVLMGRTDMPLHIPSGAVFLNRLSDDIPGLWVRHPAVNNVDSLAVGIFQQGNGFAFLMPLQPFTAEADLADLQVGFPQTSVFHAASSLSFLLRGC